MFIKISLKLKENFYVTGSMVLIILSKYSCLRIKRNIRANRIKHCNPLRIKVAYVL